MEKKDLQNFFGILAILLTVFSCLLIYYRFRSAILVFCIVALALPVIFYFAWRRLIWFCPALAAVLDLVIFWSEFDYYESRGLFLYITLLQILAIAIIILILKFVAARIKR